MREETVLLVEGEEEGFPSAGSTGEDRFRKKGATVMRNDSHRLKANSRSPMTSQENENRKRVAALRLEGERCSSARLLLPLGLLLLTGCAQPAGKAVEAPKPAEPQEAAHQVEEPGLLEALQKRCGNDDHLRNVDALIRQLGVRNSRSGSKPKRPLSGWGR
jgi:hypothetical protein